jgi:hypothetical protein
MHCLLCCVAGDRGTVPWVFECMPLGIGAHVMCDGTGRLVMVLFLSGEW